MEKRGSAVRILVSGINRPLGESPGVLGDDGVYFEGDAAFCPAGSILAGTAKVCFAKVYLSQTLAPQVVTDFKSRPAKCIKM